MEPVVAEGLEGVVVARTRLSDVDGENGRLTIAGHPVEQLAGRTSFEAVCHLLWQGQLPSAEQELSTRRSLGLARARAFAELGSSLHLLRRADGMDALRALAASLPAAQHDGAGPTGAHEVTGALAVFAAAYARVRAGAEPIAPEPERAHADDLARMVTGAPCASARAAALDAYLVTICDHGLNASTFATRVVASTGSDLLSSVVAGIGALKGPLHGGAPGPVLDMLDAIEESSRAEAWLTAELDAGRRLMGMGHRIYRVRDPRAAVLERALGELEAAGLGTRRLALARSVERAAAALLARKYPSRSLQANVEFYTAVLLDAVGLPRWLFSCIFAAGRVAGWCAHHEEQRARGRLIRPASLYDGPGCPTA